MNSTARTAAASLLGAAVLVACESTVERECPAFFHPDYDRWAQRSVGEQLVFADRDGVTLSYQVTEIERNEPFLDEDFGTSRRDVSCTLTTRETLVGDGASPRITKEFLHGELSDKELEEELFLLRFELESADGTRLPQRFGVYLAERSASVTSDNYEQSFSPTLELGGVSYTDVITETVVDPAFIEQAGLPPEEAITSVSVASGVGLVSFARLDGAVFSRVP